MYNIFNYTAVAPGTVNDESVVVFTSYSKENHYTAGWTAEYARRVAYDILRAADVIDPLSSDELDEVDLTKCPKCGGEADNGHDRCVPPNPYFCTKCLKDNV